MNKHQRDALIAALQVPPNEGGYKKGKYTLVEEGLHGKPDRFCCLGVACDIFGLWEKDGYDQPEGLNPKQMRTLGMSISEHDLLAKTNDRSDTFGPVIAALRGM